MEQSFATVEASTAAFAEEEAARLAKEPAELLVSPLEAQDTFLS